MDEIEKELESLIDEELKLEAERLVKQRAAAEAADAALRELEAAKKPEPAKRSLDDVSTEVGSTATLETGPSKKSRVVHEEVLDQRCQEPEDPQLVQQRLKLNRLEEESRNLQRLLQQKQEELLLEKQRQEHEEVARLRREAEEQKAREAAEKKARGEAEQRALAKAAAEERAKREQEEAHRRAELLLKLEQERKRRETEELLVASRARVLELKRQLGKEEEKLQATVKEPTPLLKRLSAFDEASLPSSPAPAASKPETQTQTPVSTPCQPTSVPPQAPAQPSSFQLQSEPAPSEPTPSEAPSEASTKVLGAEPKNWEDAS